MLIKNDEQLEKSLLWLTEKAEQLEVIDFKLTNPLNESVDNEKLIQDKAALWAKYNLWDSEIQQYQLVLWASDCPRTKRLYTELGLIKEEPVADPAITIPPEPATTGETSNGLEPKISPPDPALLTAKNWWED